MYPLEVIENQKPLIDAALREHWLYVFYHDMQCPMGFLAEQRGKTVAERAA